MQQQESPERMLKIKTLHADFKTSPHLWIGVLDEISDPRGVQVCLVSDLEFVGNARFQVRDLFIYPSIQSFIWKVAVDTNELMYPELGALEVSDLDLWPTSDKKTRLELAGKYDFPYFSAQKGVGPTKVFNDLVMDLFELGQDFVISELEPNFMSFEKYLELWKNNPIELMHSDQDLSLAIGSRNSLNEHVRVLSDLHQHGQNKDFTRVMLTRMTDVLTSQKSENNLPPKTTQNYLTVMETLGVKRAVVSDFKPDVRYLRKKSRGSTYTVYFTGEKVA